MTEVEKYLKGHNIPREVFEKALSLLVECINDGSQELKIEVEPELMTLQDAIQEMDFGDSFKIGKSGGEFLTMVRHEDDRGMKALKSDLHEDYVFVEPGLLLTKGEIIPADMLILTAEDMLCHMDDFDKRCTGDIILYGEAMDKNGQRKQWIKLKDIGSTFHEMSIPEIEETIEDLKPLE